MPANTPNGNSHLGSLLQNAVVYRGDPRFEEREIEYKLRLGHALGTARAALLGRDSSWWLQLERALKSSDNNIITWRLRPELFDLVRHGDSVGLEEAWADRVTMARRIAALEQFLVAQELRSPGARLSIGSTLFMALGATEYPPIRTEVFNAAFALAGYARFRRDEPPAERYGRAVRFLDEIVAGAAPYGLPVRHRLDAQGILWCMTGGWKADPPIQSEDMTNKEAAAAINAEPGADRLSETERQAIATARLGQGLFRDTLIQMWGACSVTGCADTRLLRASHLKPWRNASNPERLTPYNGLLLTATLDAALDRGLITFADDGTIMLSPVLGRANRKAAAIDAACRLRFVEDRHRPFLRYHRENVFQSAGPHTRRRPRAGGTAHGR